MRSINCTVSEDSHRTAYRILGIARESGTRGRSHNERRLEFCSLPFGLTIWQNAWWMAIDFGTMLIFSSGRFLFLRKETMFRLVVPALMLVSICGTATSTAQIVADGGFELGRPNPEWAESSTNFGSPICSVQLCTGFFGEPFEHYSPLSTTFAVVPLRGCLTR